MYKGPYTKYPKICKTFLIFGINIFFFGFQLEKMPKRTGDKRDLSEEDLQFIISNTGFDKEKVLQWFEAFKIQCPDLQLDKETFINFYSKLIPGIWYFNYFLL